MTRGGSKRGGTDDDPQRRCIASGEALPRAGLVRFVVGPDAVMVPDILARLPGRGIWVTADPELISRAADKRLFARAARAPVTSPPDLAMQVEKLLAARVVELVSLARKAGEAVAGYEKVREWLMKGRASVLLQASDGSERGRARLRPPAPEGALVTVLTASELGLAFGRERVIHAALAAGGLATRVVEEAARLAGMRGQIGGAAAGKDTKDA